MPYDILVLGATGFTGRLIVRYLNAHPQHRTSFSLGIAGRSQSKLDALKEQEKLDDSITVVQVDVTQPSDIERAVKDAKVVINTVGPFIRWGAPVVRACVEHNVHYVDITGEVPWIYDIIQEFHDRALQNSTIVIPASGFDSVPSDYSAYLAHKALKSVAPNATMAETTSAFTLKAGISGGTLATVFEMLEVPRDKVKKSFANFATSPVKGKSTPAFQISYRLPHLTPPVYGGTFVMSSANRAIVQRTWGLQQQAGSASAYGPNFKYTEFMQTSGWLSGVVLSLTMAFGAMVLVALKPLRSLVQKYVAQPGQGPTQDELENGFFKTVTVASSDPLSETSAPVHVKSVFSAKGDGYLLTSVFTSEAALSILLDHDKLPTLGKQGGVLTPASALGDVLYNRLMATERFEEKWEQIDDKKSA
ncbi:Saccharopine dehydrogenase-domain-containing protein [Schizophyllum amplum]|uniref:Saccharopine dehydrogenase-domain-containing protein n=1 Tax=Schizophyllum amplum TaxID=97359 RepID=A0A550CJU2_9AGAR|nr:Saccharopine dehydrogenase-domain-containing protein [Auriculariopsis ampla]